jgi:hypothetical protein
LLAEIYATDDAMIQYLNVIINLVNMRILLMLLSIPRIFGMISSKILMQILVKYFLVTVQVCMTLLKTWSKPAVPTPWACSLGGGGGA